MSPAKIAVSRRSTRSVATSSPYDRAAHTNNAGLQRPRRSLLGPRVLLEPGIGRERIVDRDLARERRRKAGGYHRVAVELPMRVVRRVKQYIVGTQVLDRSFHRFRAVGSVKRLDRQAEMVADDLPGGAVDPGHFGAKPAPELAEPPQETGQPRHPGFN